jgi:hypothetical protein
MRRVIPPALAVAIVVLLEARPWQPSPHSRRPMVETCGSNEGGRGGRSVC